MFLSKSTFRQELGFIHWNVKLSNCRSILLQPWKYFWKNGHPEDDLVLQKKSLLTIRKKKRMNLNMSRDMTKPTKWLCAQWRLCLGICPVWSVFAVRMTNAWVLSYPWPHSEDSNLTGRMPRQIRVFAGRTVILLVLSWDGSYKEVEQKVFPHVLFCYEIYRPSLFWQTIASF